MARSSTSCAHGGRADAAVFTQPRHRHHRAASARQVASHRSLSEARRDSNASGHSSRRISRSSACGSRFMQHGSRRAASTHATSGAGQSGSHQADPQPQEEAGGGAARQAAANALLQLLSPDANQPPPVTAQLLPGGAGVGLVASRDVAPEAPLLAVPLSLVLETVEGGNEVLQSTTWTGRVALILRSQSILYMRPRCLMHSPHSALQC